ncbi:amino acid ABC transporter permease [Streptomyces sp. 150FB]|uniref:amino acid ABC transporter permease n=1 Tax=Streptomyces sp. 150FB TaxID=1576605 RepID=UPI000589276E|nr:amino acid ABC transporter permease [Streptomyces sp. 150FB]KIF73628.1 amino acid ABC transporter permease [Streptomyces sp. 150FB]
MSVLFEHMGSLGDGFLVTLELTLVAFPPAVLLGTVLGVCRVVPIRPLRFAAALYVHCLRNSPLLLIMVMVVFALPYAGFTIPLFPSVALGLTLYFSCYVCETVRSGIAAIPPGQIEAARAVGLRFSQILREVVLPQTFRSMVQPLGTIFINLALGSALGAAVGVQELTGSARQFNLTFAQPVTSFVSAAIGYLLITLTAGLIIGVIERKVRIQR